MCLFTHFAAGALAGGATGNVGVAVLAGLASHVVLDALPHYDFPDWRVELTGGILTLLVLLAMPFSTWPAVVGGLSGMLPDLENLLQKLGHMKRRQFIFPSHTGLVPHGRECGPYTLVWQLLLAVACFGALALVSPATAAAQTQQIAALEAPPIKPQKPQVVMAVPLTTLINAGTTSSQVRVEFPLAEPPADWRLVQADRIAWPKPGGDGWDLQGRPISLPPEHSFNLALPRRQAPRWRVGQVRWWREPATGGDPGDLVQVSTPGICRGVPLATVHINPVGPDGGVLASLTLVLDHPVEPEFVPILQAAEAAKDAPGEVPVLLPAPVVNQELFKLLSAGARQTRAQVNQSRKRNLEERATPTRKNAPADPFSLTDHWLRLEVEETGVYRLDGYRLSTLGVPTSSVDPQKLRLYRGGGLPLAHNPELPEDQQLHRTRLHEVPILVRDGGDAWDSGDDLLFYAFGGDAWRDRLELDAAPLDHFEHPYDARGVYWLTWEGYGTPSPLPSNPRRIPTVSAASTGGQAVRNHQIRRHLEQSGIDWLGWIGDNWVWDLAISSSKVITFDLPPPVPGIETLFVLDIRAVVKRNSSNSYVNRATAWLNDDLGRATTLSWSVSDQIKADSLRVRLVGSSQAAVAGTNRLTLRNDNDPDPNTRLSLALDSCDLLAWTPLHKTSGQLAVTHWGHQVSSPGSPVDLQIEVPDTDVLVWDVSVADSAHALQPSIAQEDTIFLVVGMDRDPDTRRHLVVFAEEDLLEPAALSTFDYRPISLRSRTPPAHYVVIFDHRFQTAATMLTNLRSENLPGIPDAVAIAVDEQDIYDNFSGGLKDPYALRNFLRWLTLERPEPGDPVAVYACFLGDASRDFRNYQNHDPDSQLYDFLPTAVRTEFPDRPRIGYSTDPYATDDELVSFDLPLGANPLDIPDLVSGRLTVVDAEEAISAVQRIADYSNAPEPGLWRNRIVLSADDMVTPDQEESGGHIRQAETIVNHYIPSTLDVNKIYLTEYEKPPGSSNKPGARLAARNLLNQGTTIFHYVGHGSNAALADEQVLLLEDVYGLANGERRGLFTAFSCDVGIYESPITQSMAEIFISQPDGGSIASICASQVSWSTYNDRLAYAFYNNLYADGRVDPTRTLGNALWAAKVDIGDTLGQYITYMRNAQRYLVFGDPAIALPQPASGIVFAPESADSLRGGVLETVVVDLAGQELPEGSGVTYDLRVDEARNYTSASSPNGWWTVYYWLPGAAVFRGTGEVRGQNLSISFKVPTQLRYGAEGRVRLLITSAEGEYCGAEALDIVVSNIGTPDDVDGPAIDLAFEDDRYRVRAGTQLGAALQDTSGISILGTNPSNSVLLEFDETGFMVNVSDAFSFEPGSYTAGQVAIPLPADLELGSHKAALHASDVLGNVGSDTLSFLLVAASVASISDVTIFPNPTPGPCRLIFELSDPMRIEWDIFTVAGNHIKSMNQDFATAGPKVMSWDGRDREGDDIANGVYLYVLRGQMNDNEGRDIKQTGQLVIMK